MSIPVNKWKDMSFYTGFNYMRLIQSGTFTVTTSTTTIGMPAGTGVPFIEVYGENNGRVVPITSMYLTSANYYLDATQSNLIITVSYGQSVPAHPAYTKINYFIYRSNA